MSTRSDETPSVSKVVLLFQTRQQKNQKIKQPTRKKKIEMDIKKVRSQLLFLKTLTSNRKEERTRMKTQH